MGKRLLIFVVILLAAPIALLGVLLYTSTGLDLIARQLPYLHRYGVYIEGVSGTLAGPLRVERFELKHPRVHVLSHDIEIDPQLRGLLLQTIRARSVVARDSLVEIHDIDTPPNDNPPRFLPSFMRIDARGVDLDKVRYVNLDGTAIEADQVHGRVTITSRRLRVRGFQVTAPAFDAAGELRLIADQTIAIQGRSAGRLRLPQAELAIDARVNGPVDRLAIEADLLEPQRAAVQALFTRAEDQWRLAGEVRSASFALDLLLQQPPFSLSNVALQFVAERDEIRTAGSLIVPELHSGTLTLDARGRFADRVLRVASAELGVEGTDARIQATGAVSFKESKPELDAFASWRALSWPLSGEAIVTSASGSGSLRGALPYDFEVNAQIGGPGLPEMRGEAQGAISQEQLTVARYRVDAFEGSIRGAGSLQWSAPHVWTASAAAVDVNPAGLQPELPGRVSFDARASGVGLDRDASFKLQLQRLSGILRGERVQASGRVQRDRAGWSAEGVDAAFGAATLKLDAQWRETISARWNLHAPSLARLLPQAIGSLDSSGEASGARDSLRIKATARGANLRYSDWTAARLSIDADLDASGQQPSRLFVEGERIGGDEPLVGELRLKGSGTPAEHRLELELEGIAPDARGAASQANVQFAGTLEGAQWNAKVAAARLMRGAHKELPLELVEPARLSASPEFAQLENLCLNVGAGRLCGDGSWRRTGKWEATVAGYEIPLAMVLPPASQDAEYSGRVEGRIHANGAPGQVWQGDAGMRIIDAAIVYRPPGAEPQTLNLGTGGLGATATAQRIDFSFGVQAFTDTFVYADAQLQRNLGGLLADQPLTGEVRARAADANILPLLFPEIDHAAGVLSANARVAGTLRAPELSGRIELNNGEFDSYRVNLALRELNVSADLASNDLEFRGSGRAGEGRLQMDGRFEWREGVSRGELRLKGDNLLVSDLPEYRVVASPDLRFRIQGEQMNVSGAVAIPSALVQPNQITGVVRNSDDTRYVGEHPAEREGRFAVRSEVRISMGDDVRVDAFGLQGRITGGVLASAQTGQPPTGRGELGVVDGRYRAYGQKLEISRGQLLFDGSPLDDPGLDIEARRRIDATTVGLSVRGTLQEPRLTLFSDPSMPQSQILTWLLTGKANDPMRTADADTVSAARNTLALQGGGFLASQLGRRLGLDEVGVENTVGSAGEANSTVVLGKFLSPRLFISYGISLTESINTLKLRYTISDRWVLRTEAGEQQSADIEFNVER